MQNITKVVTAGTCVGCGACDGCEHISFQININGFPAPVVDEGCTNCGECLKRCIYDFDRED